MIPGITAGNPVAGGPQLWTPAQVTTQLWFDAADAATITIATGVSQWNDKSGNARNVTQSTAANQPAHGAVTLNGLPVLTYNFMSSLRKATATAGLVQNVGAVSIYSVRRFTDLASNASSPVVVAVSDNTATTGRASTYCSEVDDQERMGGIRADGQSFQAPATSTAINNEWSMHAALFNYASAQASAFKNGSAALAPTLFQDAGNTSNTSPATIGVGCWVDGSLSMKGEIAEIILTHAIDTTERQLIEGYLAWKWGLQGSLPADHPYKSAAPTV